MTTPSRVTEAIAHWQAETALRFVPRTTQVEYINVVVASEGCQAQVGRRVGTVTTVRISTSCGRGALIHEFGHALGAFHEQARADRDSHVIINWANIIPGKEGNFKTYVERGYAATAKDIGPYDFGSMMHYSSYSFSANGKPTIVRKSDGSTFSANRTALSANDLKAIATLYGYGVGQDTAAPTTPANLRVASKSLTSASIAWNASTDNVEVAGYRVFVNGALAATVKGATTYTHSGMRLSTYRFRVEAFDHAGNVSLRSNEVSATL